MKSEGLLEMDENLGDGSHHFNEKNIDLDSTSSSKLETNEVLGSNFEGNGVEKDEEVAKCFRYRRGVSEESVDTKLDRNSYGHGYGMKQNLGQEVEEMRRISGSSVDNWVNGNGRGVNLCMPKLIRERLGDDVGGIKSAEQERLWEFSRSTGGASRHGRLSGFPYYGERISNYHPGSYGYWGAMDNGKRIDRLSRVEDLEPNRAELLRKLDELKDQINRSCDIVEKTKERVFVDRQMVQNGICSHIPEDPSGLSRNSAALYGFDKHAPLQHPHFNQGTRLVDMQGLPYLMRRMPAENPAHEDPYRLHMFQRAPNQLPRHYFPQRVEESFPAGCSGFDQESVLSYSIEPSFHSPSCSCLRCYNRNWDVPTKVPPTILANGRIPNAQINPFSVHLRNHGALGPLDHQYSGANSLPLHPHDPYHHMGRPNNFGPETAGFGQRLPGTLYHPISGGTPFITCLHCFQLLKLPRKKIVIDNGQQKLRCGACSNVILLLVEKKRLFVSIPSEAKLFLNEVDEGRDEKMSECARSSHGGSPAAGLASFSTDYGDSGDNFQAEDTYPSNLLEERRPRSDSEGRHALNPPSSRSPGNKESIDREILVRDGSNSDPLPLKDISPPGPHASLQELFDYSTAMRRVQKEDQSKSMDQEKAIPDKCTHQHSAATETEVSYEYVSSNSTQENSAEVSNGNDHKANNKGLENEITNVTVNGQPIPDYVVKNAEKLAGPIRPGDYWYDYHAGFWGVMGYPCLGMIPPFIEEFNYPMPENCAGGRTGVFVNGRELHRKDLNLLASRGLPTTRHKSYFIEISGRVMDEDTGEELDSLGKLAPSVQRAQKGRGMRVPRVIA